jgi:hypothetical protein
VKVREGECGWRWCRSEVGVGEIFCERHRDMADGVVMGWCVRKCDAERERERQEAGVSVRDLERELGSALKRDANKLAGRKAE